MRYLNVTGCEEVTSSGLKALIKGKSLLKGAGTVVEARAFFGFCPREDSTSVELTEAQQLLEERSAREIVAYFRAYRRRCKASDARVELRLHGASRKISRKCMAWLRRRRQANKERMKRREFYTRELQRFWRGYCGRRDIWNAKEYARSRRPVVWRRLHAIDATRVHQTRSWVVYFSNLRPFGLSREIAPRRRWRRCAR